ncbi:hypothetical protein ACS0TY_029421 [Phlomoides rotata]
MMSDIKEAASIIGSEIAAASQVLCKAIRVDAEISEKQQKIDSEIRKITNLSTAEVIKVVHHITKSHELIDVFFSMTEEGREDLVRAILNGDSLSPMNSLIREFIYNTSFFNKKFAEGLKKFAGPVGPELVAEISWAVGR